jgi:hypothetical protein
MSASPATIDIQTCPQEVPTIPPWFAEVAVLARHFQRRGLVETLVDQVRLARGRLGRYEVLDFVALLLGYAVSGEPTLEAFFARLAPFATPFMALFGRDRLPHRSTLSRFLDAVDAPCLEALRRLFEQDLAHHGFAGEQLGGLLDRAGQQLIVIDVDATRQAARQRALATGPDLPPPRRRMADVCAPGYTGRKRGEVVRTRTTVLQAHTQEWLGTFAGAGNGDYAAELEAACRSSASYLRAKGLSPAHGLLRLDGLYGTASTLARLHQHGLGFLVRGRDYHLLDHPLVQARLQHPCDQALRHPETQVQRELFEVGYIVDWLAPLTGAAVTCRVVVTRRPAPADPEEVAIGKLVGDHVYELFLTSHPAHRLPAADLLELYNGRGGFEQVLSDEDDEQAADRWCSHHPQGQEFWQILSQWVWNTRLALGQVYQERPPRWTVWSAAGPAGRAAPPALPTAMAPEAALEEERVADYGPLELARPWAKARGRFAGQDFALLDDGTLRCPAGNLLRPRGRCTLPNGDQRVMYSAKEGDCRACSLAAQCLGRSGSGKNPRRVSAVRRLRGYQVRPKQLPWQGGPPDAGTASAAAPRELLWGDLPGRRIRRDFFRTLRQQRVTLDMPPGAAAPLAAVPGPRRWTRAERAHRRLPWAARVARNALAAGAARCTVTLWGIPPQLAAHLDLPSTLAA